MIRIGHGYDIHATQAGAGIVLGGVSIPADFSLRAHSDGDVVLHALIDALLGAVAMGDIGRHFPDSDPAWKDADSARLLETVLHLLHGQGWYPVNVDITIIAERPRLSTHVDDMRNTIARLVELGPDAVSVKATTHEGLGPLGQGDGVAAHAVTLVERVL